MKKFKRLLIVVAGLIAVPLIAAALMSKTFVVERSVTIQRPRDEVFTYLRHLRNHERFNKWSLLDPATRFSYRGEDGTEGSVMAWKSDDQNVGIGEQEITKLVEGERIDVEIRFTKPFVSTDPAYITTKAVGDDATRVTNVYLGKIPYPVNLICFAIAEKIGGDMQESLDNLKRLLEEAE